MNIEENNRLIADFRGLVYKFDGMNHHIQLFNPDGTPKRSGQLIESEWTLWNPHTNWNDLMEVVEKIESLSKHNQTYSFSITKISVRVLYKGSRIVDLPIDSTKIEAVYNACVEFIKWYKLNK